MVFYLIHSDFQSFSMSYDVGFGLALITVSKLVGGVLLFSLNTAVCSSSGLPCDLSSTLLVSSS
jgi:hypothetical protein